MKTSPKLETSHTELVSLPAWRKLALPPHRFPCLDGRRGGSTSEMGNGKWRGYFRPDVPPGCKIHVASPSPQHDKARQKSVRRFGAALALTSSYPGGGSSCPPTTTMAPEPSFHHREQWDYWNYNTVSHTASTHACSHVCIRKCMCICIIICTCTFG